MKDLYETLGIAPDASSNEIKKAFRKLALDAHPDKGGNGERMGLLNEAYQTLSDPERRRDFDAAWEAYQSTGVEQQPDVEFDGYLTAGNVAPYSQVLRAEHRALVMQYKQTPLMKNDMSKGVQPFASGIYQSEEPGIDGHPYRQYHDIFKFIRYKTERVEQISSTRIPTEPLTPVVAINLFIDFLSGRYYGAKLSSMTRYLTDEIRKVRSRNAQESGLLLYEGIFEIISMVENRPVDNSLIFSIKKITDFSKKMPEFLLPSIIPLFYNKFFRNLHAYALHLYWNSSEGLFDADNLNQFDGYQEAKELLDVLRARLSSGNRNENLSKLIQYIKLIFNFEKDKHEVSIKSQSADDYREAAFHFLDWLPVFVDQSSRQIIANIFLQIGIKFQQASRIGSRPEVKMADERLAFKMYLTAAEIGHNTTPDVGIYANTQAIKYISAFKFQDEMLMEVLPALKKRTFISTDIFPFFDTHQSNVVFLREENKTLHLMRQLLNAMMNAHEYNKTHSDGIAIDHSAVTILYQAYEACLKNWYQEEFDPAVEQKFRLDLMEELLFENGWTSLDVEQQIDSPWIMIDRDEAGWIRPTRSLPYTENQSFVKYRAINGAEVNNKTGEINFFMTQWTPDRPVYEKLFTLFDLQEMLEKNMSGAIFSLDPVDPYKPFHPYNLMRFAPSQLCESELLNTMLLTDYILKFLTTNQEVQGQYPFDQRPVASMIQHLPGYLRQIIENFHSAQHAGALHRFWIEAEEIDISLLDEAGTQKDLTRIGLGELKMVVKKHRMERDIHGELKDVGNDDEGWPIYVLTSQQMRELQRGSRVIDGHAMIFIYAEERVFFWENNEMIKLHVPEDYRETLIRLFKQPKDIDGKVAQNTKNRPLMYRATKEMTRQAGLSHRYSPEFIFAHEFTTHYNEFAQYLPEFGRLRELSRISSLIRILDGMRHSNKECTEALDFILNGSSQLSPPKTDAYRRYHQAYKDMHQQIKSTFKTWNASLATHVLQTKWRDQISKIKDDVGTLNFTRYSKEVNEECVRQTDYSYRNSQGYSRSEIERIIDGKRADFASQFSTSKQASVRRQMTELFSSPLSSLGSSAYGRLIDSFMSGNINPLADALFNHEKTKAQQDIKKQFPTSSINDIALALDDPRHTAVTRIAKEESSRLLREQKVAKDNLETGFVRINLGKHEEPVDLEGKCLWVPASVRHDVRRDNTTGLTRYSFFVYGGVSVQPRINMVAGGNAALGGNQVGGGSFGNVNAQAAMNNKLRALQKAQNISVRTEQFTDGRIRYYTAERRSRTSGPTRGNAHVTEYNPKTGQVRAWAESYDHKGNVNRVHPKMVNGQVASGQHYPPTQNEVKSMGRK